MDLEFVFEKDTRHLRLLAAQSLACHSAVLAQSGSGKSFMVGRLVEELVLRTKARIVILDPNSDFVRLPEVNREVWDKDALRPWFSPTDTLATFSTGWGRRQITVLSNRNLQAARPLRICWGSLTDAERAAVMGIDPTVEPEIFWSLILVDDVARARWVDQVEPNYDFEHFRTVADDLCDFLLGIAEPTGIADAPLAQTLRTAGPRLALRFRTLIYALEEYDIWRSSGDDAHDIGEVIVAAGAGWSALDVDLLSVDRESERLALATRALEALWRQARDNYSAALRDAGQPDRRVPTIVIIDEAHNLVPAERATPAAERLASLVVRIAAEGRKFGLYLLIVTQRPRKVDPNVLSECDNLILMRMSNDGDIKSSSELFGFVDATVLPRAKTLGVGDLFLQGRCGGGTTTLHVAPRRTREGGRNLTDYWITR